MRWAESHYLSTALPPLDISGTTLTDSEIAELFARVSSRRAHLALVDQPGIRTRLSDPALAEAAKAAWARNRRTSMARRMIMARAEATQC